MKNLILTKRMATIAGMVLVVILAGVVTLKSINVVDNAMLTFDRIEAIAENESGGCPQAECISGGCYSASCDLTRKIEIGGFGFTLGEEVSVRTTAQDGAFACCYVLKVNTLVSAIYAHCYPNICC